jgi:hypothetical protein
LYLAGGPISQTATDYGGIYRIAFDGGTPEKLVSNYVIATSSSVESRLLMSLATGQGNTFLGTPTDVYKIPPGSQVSVIVASPVCVLFGMTANDENLFFSVQTSEDLGTYELLQLPL